MAKHECSLFNDLLRRRECCTKISTVTRRLWPTVDKCNGIRVTVDWPAQCVSAIIISSSSVNCYFLRNAPHPKIPAVHELVPSNAMQTHKSHASKLSRLIGGSHSANEYILYLVSTFLFLFLFAFVSIQSKSAVDTQLPQLCRCGNEDLCSQFFPFVFVDLIQ